MEVKVTSNDEFAARAADYAEAAINSQSVRNLCFPTGDTPQAMYRELVRRFERGELSFAQVHAFGLDEWGDLSADDPSRCIARLRHELYDLVDLPASQIHYLEPNHSNVAQMCRQYEDEIAACGGLTLSIVGIGLNGHVGFNEPGSQVTDGTRVVSLAARTKQVASKYNLGMIPDWGVTMGLATLLASQQVLILATGEHKASIVRELLQAEPSEQLPASWFLRHPQCVLLLDEAAASEL